MQVKGMAMANKFISDTVKVAIAIVNAADIE